MKDQQLVSQWIKTGAICGILGGSFYFTAAFLPMPDMLVYIAAFGFGPLLAIACTGLFYFLSDGDKSPRLQIALVSAIAGCVLLVAMLTVQQSIFVSLKGFSQATDEIGKTARTQLGAGLNSVQLGLDVAWDIFISIAVILFSYSMFKKSLLWKIVGSVGLVLGLLLLFFNLYYFPTPPIDVDSIDWGPFVAIWLLIVFIFLLTVKATPKSVTT